MKRQRPDGRRRKPSCDDVPRNDDKGPLRHLKNRMAFRILPYQIFELYMPGKISEELLYRDGAPQHILSLDGIIKYPRRPAAEKFQY